MSFLLSLTSSSSSRSQLRRWGSDLPDDILVNILGRLTTLQDFYAVRGVCHNWREVAIPNSQTLRSQLPLFLILSISDVNAAALFDIFHERKYGLRILGRTVSGYSNGHLITTLTQTRDHVRNPRLAFYDIFTRLDTILPSHGRHNNAGGVLLSGRPDVAPCRVIRFNLTLKPTTVEYLTIGEDGWSSVSHPVFSLLKDMIFCEGRLLALVARRPYPLEASTIEVMEVELEGDHVNVQRFGHSQVLSVGVFLQLWLVKVGRDVLVIAMTQRDPMPRGKWRFRFRVFRWEETWGAEKEWEEILDLGDKSIFVSEFGPAVCIPARGLLPKNHIYSVTNLSNKQYVFYSMLYKHSMLNTIPDNFAVVGTYLPSLWVFPSDY